MRPLLDAVGVNQQQLRQMITAELSHLPKASGGAPPQLGAELTRVLDGAQQAATEMKDDFVSTEHLLLALARVKSKAQDTLKLNAVSEKELLAAMQKVRGSARVTSRRGARPRAGRPAGRRRGSTRCR